MLLWISCASLRRVEINTLLICHGYALRKAMIPGARSEWLPRFCCLLGYAGLLLVMPAGVAMLTLIAVAQQCGFAAIISGAKSFS